MPILTLAPEWRIATDEHSWRVERRKQRNDRASGEPVSEWRAVTYHGTLGQAVESFAQRAVRDSDATDAATLAADIENVVAALSEALRDCIPDDVRDQLAEHGRRLRKVSAR